MSFDSSKGFEPKKALEEWKKAKPFALKETGVGDLLRALPPAPAPGQLSKYVEIQGKLKAKLADPNIKKEPKAVKCIDNIHDDIASFLQWYKSSRTHIIDRMNNIVDAMKAFQKVLEKDAANPQKLHQAHMHVMVVAKQNPIDSRSFPPSGKSIFPPSVGGAWLGVTNVWASHVLDTIKFLEKKPAPDPAGTEALEMIKTCKLNTTRVAQVAALLKAI